MTTPETIPGLPSRRRRPLSVTLLALGVLSIASVNLLRFWNALQQWDFLVVLLPISPLYLVASGFVWGLTGLILFYGLWRGRRWAPRLSVVVALFYTCYYWLDRLLVSSRGFSANWFFVGMVNLVLLSMILWVTTRPKAKAFFGVIHDHESEN